jgi:Hydrazine synthase alpha subunit middle domain/WD40-like Beta Propeller Repeat
MNVVGPIVDKVASGWLHKLRAVRLLTGAGVLAVTAAALSACSGGGNVAIANSQSPDPATVDFPIFYVKRTIPTKADDLRMMRFAVPTADLYKRQSASPSATETNITARITATGTTAGNYDVKDVDASPDGKTVVFAMRGPLPKTINQKKPPFWRIWIYDIATDNLHQAVDPATDQDPTANDVAPHFMPDGRIVFASTRQSESQAVLLDEGKPQFEAQNEDRNEPAFVLHVMNADGTGIHQISFNQSNDRDPIVLSSGRILWSRWDHAPGKDAMHLYTSNPDGTDVQLYYGANSHNTGTTADGTTNNAVIEFVKPREMQDGRILTVARPYTYPDTNVDFGGDLLIIDGAQYVENTQPLLSSASLTGPAQVRATPNNVVDVPGPSPGGRFNSASPLWDSTGRILVTWSQCRLLDNTQTPPPIVPCTSARLADPAVQVAPVLYSVWMFDPVQNTLLPVMPPVEGVMVTDLVAAQPRQLQNIVLDHLLPQGADPTIGEVDIKSVYDFDGVDRAQPNIPTVADPTKTPAANRAARFVRLEKAVSIPDKTIVDLAGAAFGASGFMKEIMGYAPVQPDGSVRIQVPANVAFQISVLDANGRRIAPVHNAWLQVKGGEVLVCNGCHTPAAAQNLQPGQLARSHGRQGLFNPAYSGLASGGNFPGTNPALVAMAGETMAETLGRLSCENDTPRCIQKAPSMNVSATEVWSNPPATTPNISLRYQDLVVGENIPVVSTGCLTTWISSCRTVINYPQHIQVIWDAKRQTTDPTTGAVLTDHTCTQGGCHSTAPAAGATATVQVPAGQLNLTSTASDDEPLQPISYRHLLFTHNEQAIIGGALQDAPGPPDANGNPTTIPVGPYMDAGSANGALSNAFLGRFGPGARTPAGGVDHATFLNSAELRLISEWLDIGAQFFNNPFDPAVPVN